MNKSFLIIVVTAFIGACSPARLVSDHATPLLEDSTLASAHVGIHIYDIDKAKTIYDHQGHKYFVPASNTKIVSCYAAMTILGDSLVSAEVAENDTAVFIKPKGDPTLLHPDYKNQPVISFLQRTAKPVYIVPVEESITPFGPGWSWNDYNFAYSAERSSFPVYGNIVKWVQERTGDAPTQENVMDESIAVYSIPEVNWKVRFTTDTSVKNFYVQRDPVDNIFRISQGHEAKKTEQDVPFITGGVQAAIDLLPDTVRQPVYLMEKELPAGLQFRPIYSQPVDSVLRPMMHRSDNFFAEQVLLMGAEKLFHEMDESKVVKQLLTEDLNDLPQPPRWADGSGLSKFNLFSPRDFTHLLVKMKTTFGMERLKQIFPTGGQGTLRQFYLQDSGTIYTGQEKSEPFSSFIPESAFPVPLSMAVDENALMLQVQNNYILATTNRGFILIDQQAAHERVLYESYARAASGKPVPTQRSLFPVTLELSPQDNALLNDLLPDLHQLGYHVEPFGRSAFVIQGTPADVDQGNEKKSIENLLEQFKHFSGDLKFSKREQLVRTLAAQNSIGPGKTLSSKEMKQLVEELFSCTQPNVTASGRPVYIEFKKEYLEQLFRK